LHTKNQLPGLPESAIKVAQQQHGVSWVGWWQQPKRSFQDSKENRIETIKPLKSDVKQQGK
jgi:hypothetical protein